MVSVKVQQTDTQQAVKTPNLDHRTKAALDLVHETGVALDSGKQRFNETTTPTASGFRDLEGAQQDALVSEISNRQKTGQPTASPSNDPEPKADLGPTPAPIAKKSSLFELETEQSAVIDPKAAEAKAEKPERSGISGFFIGMAEDFGLTNIAKGIEGMSLAVKANVLSSYYIVKGSVQSVGAVVGLSSIESAKSSFSEAGSQVLAMGAGLKGIGQAAWGVTKLVGEVSGVTDLGKSFYHCSAAIGAAFRGDMDALREHAISGALHGAFAIASMGSIVATVATGGAAGFAVVGVAAARVGLKTTAQKALMHSAKLTARGLGEEVVSKLVTNVGTEAIQAAGRELAQQVPKEVVARCEKELTSIAADRGVKSLTELGKHLSEKELGEMAERTAKEITKDRVSKKLAEWNVSGLVEEAVTTNLDALSKMSKKELAQHLSEKSLAEQLERGVAREIAEKEAKEFGEKTAGALHRALRGKGSFGVGSEVGQKMLADGLTEQITKEATEGLRKDLIDVMMKESEEVIQSALEDLGKKFGLSAAQKEAMANGLKKGMKEGAEEAIEKAVREGVERALARRFRRRSGGAMAGKAAQVGMAGEELEEVGEVKPVVKENLQEIEKAARRDPTKREPIAIVDYSPQSDGTVVIATKVMEWNVDRGRYELSSVNEFVAGRRALPGAIPTDEHSQRILSAQAAQKLREQAQGRTEENPFAA